MSCPNEKTLSSYLDERLSGAERDRIEGHLSECDNCLDILLVAYEANRIRRTHPPLLKEKIARRMGLKPGEKKRRGAPKWLLSCLLLFALSFVFRKYFMQFLVGAAILGFKWAMEGEGAKKVVMIFRGMENKEKKFERKSHPPVSNITGGGDYGD